jgi:predicted amidohydrolase
MDCLMGGRVTIGAITATPTRCDKDGNVALAERLVAQCAEQGAQLVVMPEGFLDGYAVNAPGMTRDWFLALAEPRDGPYVTQFCELARVLGIWLLACFSEREGERAYNTALLIDSAGTPVGHYRKTHVQSGNDWRFYAPGQTLPVFSSPWGLLGVMICYDRQFPEVPRALMRQGARVILNPSWGMFNEMNEAMMRTRAYENGVFVVFAHVQGALVLNTRGDVAARSAPADCTLVYEIDLDDVVAVRQQDRGHFTVNLRPELYAASEAARSVWQP